MDESTEKPEDDQAAGSDSMEDAMAAAMAEAMGQTPKTPTDADKPASDPIEDAMAAAMAEAMSQTPKKPTGVDESAAVSIEDEMEAAMAEAMGGVSKSDPSSLLASAANGLKHIKDPVYEGAPKDQARSPSASSGARAQTGDYSRAVLSIETHVAVVLAKKKISIDGIINMVPGSMLTFDAHCDEPLTLEAGGYPIAMGETVKIGDKFGLRIRQLLHSAG